MAYDEELADRIRYLMTDPATEKKMFGGLAFLIGGNMSVAASGQGGLMVRVEPDQTAALLAEPGAEEFDMGGRGDVLEDDKVLKTWVTRGVTYAKSLPPK